MKRFLLTGKRWLCAILSVLLLSAAAAADETGEIRMASEYVSEGMMNDFEQPGAVVPTAASAEGLDVSAVSALLMERDTGTVLFEKNADEQRAPASITKIMTLLLTMEAIDDGKLALTDRVAASAHARSMGGSQIWLEDGEVMTVDELLKAVCVASANDAAVALAEHIAGSEEAFVAQMNRRAEQLGMTGTHFVNCCGLDADGHVTTARDIAVMSAQLLAHPLITEYSTIWMDSLRGGETQLVNTNKLVRFYEGATGLKTGTTDQAGYCVSATAAREGMELIAVVLAGASGDKRFADAKTLLNFGFANYAVAKAHPEELTLENVAVTHGTAPWVSVQCEPAGSFLVEKGKQEQITPKISLAEQVEAPVEAGQVVGKITYLLDNRVLGESRLLAGEAVPRMTFSRALSHLLAVIFGL